MEKFRQEQRKNNAIQNNQISFRKDLCRT